MEFRIAADELKKALYRAQGIVERKTTMPILANVLVNATKGGVTVTAFDLDIGIVSEHPAEVSKPGAVTLSAKYVFDIVQNLPDAQVTLKKLANNYVDISSGSAHFKIVGMAAEEYPKLPKEENAPLVQISGNTLLEMIKKTQFAISSDETRYILNGVFFEPQAGGKVRMVATDGHRLSLIERELAGDFKLKSGVIIPRKGLMELKRLLDEAPDAECHLGFAENSALFKKPGLTMVMRLIDGQFPEYQRVIPKEGEKVVHGVQGALPREPQAHRPAVGGQELRRAHRPGGEQAAHHRQQPGPGRGQGRARGGLPRRRHHHRLQRPLPHRRALRHWRRTRCPSSWATSTAPACSTPRATAASPPS